jgi:hypothetical protein
MTEAEIATFKSLTGGREPPRRRVRELWVCVGRGGAKTSIASLIACHAALTDVSDRLRPGERNSVIFVANAEPCYTDAAAFGFLARHWTHSPIPTLRNENNQNQVASGINHSPPPSQFSGSRSTSVPTMQYFIIYRCFAGWPILGEPLGIHDHGLAVCKLRTIQPF